MNQKDKKPCYKCKGPWSENHKCKGVQINLVEGDGDKPPSDSESEPPSDDDLTFNSEGEVLMISLDEPEILTTSMSKTDEVWSQADIQDAEYMFDPTLSTGVYCPAQCTALVNGCEATIILDTGAGGSVVSSNYLKKIDPHWESKVSSLGPKLWKGYGSSLQPRGGYTTHVVIGHPRGNMRCNMNF